MNSRNDLRRREFLAGAAGLGALAGTDLLLGCSTTGQGLLAGATPGVRYFTRFGVDEALLQRVLGAALSTGADFADVFVQHQVTNNLWLEDNEVKAGSCGVALGAGVRVIQGDQTGYAYTEDLTPEALLRTARAAASLCNGPARSAPARLRMEGPLPQRYLLRQPWEAITTPEKIELLTRANRLMQQADKRVKKAQVFLGDQAGAVLMADSTGRVTEDFQPMSGLSLSCTAEQNGHKEENYSSYGGRLGFDVYTPALVEKLARDAVKRAVVLFEAEQPLAGEMPVVLGPGTSGVLLHEAIGHGLEADFNRKGLSVYSDQVGKKVAYPFVNVVDDGTLSGARGALNVDDEGNVAGRTVLIEGGKLAGYLHDTISARHYGVRPTGNGRRESYEFAPVPRMRSTYMLPGWDPLESTCRHASLSIL